MIVKKDFNFSESESSAVLSVPLNGVRAHKADVYANDLYVKVNFPPFFFEADLCAPIDAKLSTATVGNGVVTFQLVKKDPVLWGTLHPIGLDKEQRLLRRQAAFKRAEEDAEKEKEAKRVAKREEDRMLVQMQMEAERKGREQVEAIKNREKEEAEAYMADFISAGKALQAAEPTETAKPDRSDSAIFAEDAAADDEDELPDDDGDDGIDMGEIMAKVRKQMEALKATAAPAPRAQASIDVRFTSRGLIPTAVARESEDAKWVDRIYQHRAEDSQKRAGELQNPLDITERNPHPAVFLNDKGLSFFKSGNYPASLNAYDAALAIDPNYSHCRFNRADTLISLNRFQEAVDECDAVLTTMRKEDAERRSRGDHSLSIAGLVAQVEKRREIAFVKNGGMIETPGQ
ncbi:Dynein assembly factor 4, axonemal [Irineochytrium annulatum]|nr:Dynein assembly factor 4, axonemal [Irineochytrium annulatum]